MKPTTTDEVLKKMPAWKSETFNSLWDVGWRRNCSKKEAAIVWERVAEEKDMAWMIVGKARTYRKGMDGTAYLKGLAPWLNAAAWENVAEPRIDRDEQVVAAFCECGAASTRKIPEAMCDACFADKHSMQMWEGEMIPYKQALFKNLKKMGMDIKDGETRDEYSARCRERTGNFIQKQKGSLAVDTGKGI